MDPLVFSVRVFDYLFMIFDKLAQGAWNKIGGRYIYIAVLGMRSKRLLGTKNNIIVGQSTGFRSLFKFRYSTSSSLKQRGIALVLQSLKEKTKSARCRRDIGRFFVLTLEFLRIGPQFDARRAALSTS